MKIKKILKYVLLVVGVIGVVLTAGLYIWSLTGTYPARDVAQEAMQTTKMVAVSQEKWITFTPMADPDVGLIFYPGGLVEPAAYAPVLHKIAQEGTLVIITPMPLNLAIFNAGAATAVIENHPEISTWVLVGHSLGGAAAGIYAENNTEAIRALVLWDSFPPDSSDLSDNDITVLSIYGTTNDFPNTDNFDDKRHLLPSDTLFIAIEGASHAQFGDYGPQKGDVFPTLSLSDQHALVAETMVEFISQIP